MFGRRRDGVLAKVPPYRRIMPFLMRGKSESVVLFEQQLDMSRAQPWIEAWNHRTGARATAFHLVLHAIGRVLHERPHLNRFVSGRRIYDRRGVFLTFAAKKAMHDDAPLATVRRGFPADESFAEMVAALTADIQVARSDAISKVDKELGLFLRLPGFVLAASVALLRWLDGHGLAPRALIGDDPMYTSAFIANLGSLKIDAAYHHLYEYGNCPLFCTVGRLAPAPVVVDGAIEVRPSLILRYTYDERIEDGFYAASAIAKVRGWIEDPASWIGD
ncbi:MAG TPA: 2-oxo acid dehydrogenase subunit E2 [Kofleriaceae bacterium]|nr:2-oxo acid dehydrogenase subunit E2 [Kofleriaceae bacterium]